MSKIGKQLVKGLKQLHGDLKAGRPVKVTRVKRKHSQLMWAIKSTVSGKLRLEYLCHNRRSLPTTSPAQQFDLGYRVVRVRVTEL